MPKPILQLALPRPDYDKVHEMARKKRLPVWKVVSDLINRPVDPPPEVAPVAPVKAVKKKVRKKSAKKKG